MLRNHLNLDGTPGINPNIPVYETYPSVLGRLNTLSTLQQRVGNRSWASFSGNDGIASDQATASPADRRRFIEQAGMWTRMEGSLARFKPTHSTANTAADIDHWRLQMGVDKPLFHATDGSTLVGGLSVHYGKANSDSRSSLGTGRILTHGYGFGGTLTWCRETGFYVDAQAQFTWYNSDIKSSAHRGSHLVDNNNGFGSAYSLEAGKIYEFAPGWSLTPQAQVTFGRVTHHTIRDDQRTVVKHNDEDSLLGRLGLALNRECVYLSSSGDKRRIEGYVVANAYQEFLGESVMNVSGIEYKSRDTRGWAGVYVGGTYDWCDSKYSVYGEVGVRTKVKHFAESRIFHGEVGFRMNF